MDDISYHFDDSWAREEKTPRFQPKFDWSKFFLSHVASQAIHYPPGFFMAYLLGDLRSLHIARRH